ncbi:titin [Nephila pilipes]|uniref:Titin n=1 Tax=Nephila pilipes TaxID=299642 RepID=A0A8X6UUD7_NEPPI|nr:titin [Nephila pilipes]
MVSVTCLAATKIVPVSYSWNMDGKILNTQAENIRFSNTNEVSVLIIDPVSIKDSGNYTCTATNSAGTDHFTTNLIVKAHPRWILQPHNIITTLGSSISTQCYASGSPSPIIKWTKINHKSESGSIRPKYLNETTKGNATFQISSVTSDDAGVYECEADNGIPPSIKSNFTVIIRDIPKIKKFSFEENIKQGDVVSVTCLATSVVKPVKFQWNKDGQPIINSKNSRVEDGTSFSVLLFDSVELSDFGNYTCIAQNIDGTDSFTVELSVKAPPQWIEEPENFVTRVGSSVSIKCRATGSPMPKITWQKLEDKSNTIDPKNVGSSEVLKIASVDSSDAGLYQCIADNGISPNIKSNFSLTIRDIPKIRQFSFQENIVEGEAVSVMCFAVTKSKPIKFKWLKNDQTLSEQQNIRFETGSEVSVLILDPVKIIDTGNYTCTATNKDGSDTFVAALNVRASPKWVEQPSDIITFMGASIENRCMASGSPLPKIIWTKITGNINILKHGIELRFRMYTKNRDESFHGFSHAKNSSILRISPVTQEDSGLYECIADNGISPIIKSNFTLIVRDPPKVKSFRFDDNIKEGDIASVTCLATSSIKPVKFQWYKNEHPISISDSNVRIDDGAIHSVLVFDYVSLSDDGNYTCMAKTNEGQDKFTAQLNVKASPKWKEEPRNVVTESHKSISINCIAFGSPKPSITWRKQIDTSEYVNLKVVEESIEDMISGKLNLVDVSEADSGQYECMADNGISPSIRKIPKIQAFSFQDHVLEGTIVTVTCLATTKVKPISFQWFKNGKEINSLQENIRVTSANDLSVLVLDPVHLENSGNFTCSATNAVGSDKFTASLKVKASPKWIEEPVDTLTTVGSAITVRCIASGSPEPKISWKKKNGSKIIDVSLTQTNDNRNSSILRISPVAYDDAGFYECVADNGISPAISSNFTLTIRGGLLTDAPEVQKFSFQDDVLEGKVISVTCLAVTKSKPIHFLWLKNGVEISKPDSQLKIRNDNEFSVLILDPVTLKDNANYTCKASNEFGSDQHTAYLNVKAPPKWTETPKDITVTVGESITVSCFASGSPQPVVKFRKLSDKNNISLQSNRKILATNETSNHLKITSVSYEDAGFYECVADNGISPKIKSNFTIFVRDSPVLKEFQFEDNVKEGDFVSVLCIVKTGAQPITFTWHKNGEELKASSKDVSIENSPVTSVLILNSVTSESDGNYSCTAKNNFGNDRHSTTLNVKASPKWLQQPSDIITVIGDAIKVSCNASGSPKPRISWIKYSGAIATPVSHLNSTLSNDNGGIFKIPRVSYDDAGTYGCIADNGIKPRIKSNFSITIREMVLWYKTTICAYGIQVVDVIFILALSSLVYSAESPIIEKFQFKENVKEGDFVSVLCIVKTGTQPINFIWHKNGNEFKASNHDVSIENSPISSILVLNSVTSDSNGNYTCTAKNNYGTDHHSTSLKVKASPVWREQPQNITTVIGDTISIHCKALGSPDPHIYWKKHSVSGILMDVNKNSSYSNKNSTELKILKVSYDDAGIYECIADNGISPNINSIFSITIRDIPKIKKFSFEDNVQEGDLASVICLAVSNAKPLSFFWTKNGNPIDESTNNVRIDNSGEYSVLILDSVTLKSAGNYSCKVTNPVGSAIHTSQLDVKAPPKWVKVPESLVSTIGSALNIQCLATGSPSPKITWIKYSDPNFTEDNKIEEVNIRENVSDGVLKIMSVSYKDAGHYSCIANNNIGSRIQTNFTITIRGVPEIQKFFFQDNIVEGKVVSVMCLAISDSKPLQFRWDKNGKLLESTKNNVRIEDSSEFSVLIIDIVTLDSEGNYTCTATNSFGNSKHSTYLSVQAPPKWVETPSDMIKAIGESVMLKCLASGSPRPQITWRKYVGSEMKRIDLLPSPSIAIDDKDSYIKLQSLSYEDAGLYECVATNSVEPSISINFTITIRVKVEPFSFLRRFTVGERAQVTCFATVRTNNIKFQWFKDGIPVSESDNIRLKSTNEFSIIIIDPVELLSEGNYTCKAIDSNNEASHSTQLQVDASPSWLEETKDLTVSLGSSATVHCRAHGSPKPQIKLIKMSGHLSSPISQDSQHTSSNGTFIFTYISSDDAGMYICEANNGNATFIKEMHFYAYNRLDITISICCLVASFPYTLQAPPKIQPFNFKTGIRLGDKTTTLCVAESKSPLTYSWKKDGESLTEKEELRLKTDEEFSVIIIEPVKTEHSGNYTCVAKNSYGSDSFTAELIVEAPPVWQIEPENSTALPDTRHTFRCSASGSPQPVITWKKISSGTEHKEMILGNGETLTFDSLKITDGGVYECEANNGVGSPLKKFVVLGIRGTIWDYNSF